MAVFEIKNGVYSVGVLNPNLRIFDIIMKTEYGTSYNAYLIKGEEKVALVETVHTTFFDEYLDNIRSIVDIHDIDYVILNHTEPDHSGSLKYLLRENPNIKVIGSMAANKYLQGIVNNAFESQVVRDGDTIDLGGKTLRFIIAPFLHWPDSMFTYIEEDNLLFSCDFLGCHFCEPRMFDNKIVYKENFEDAFKYYYDVIFSPFKEHVLNGIEKIKDLQIDTVCPSHGPILIETIDKAVQLYKEWSSDILEKNNPKKVVIPYVSAYGCTRRMAEELEKAIKSVGDFEVEVINIIYHDLMEIKEKIEKADAFLFGSPTINRDAVKPIWDVLSVVEPIKNKGKLCGVFGSYGWSGESIKMMEERVKSLKLNLFGEGLKANFVPSEEELKKIYDYGVAFAKKLQER
ncbi:MAG: hypothetical protein PWP27_2124 [Clostridiales bacterium]|jgi:flavorubredoxin|nr:hypothetical protein [Clostridiales bacterium]MDK2934314.1 hypothetical protein [Clostridiales bacterium]